MQLNQSKCIYIAHLKEEKVLYNKTEMANTVKTQRPVQTDTWTNRGHSHTELKAKE